MSYPITAPVLTTQQSIDSIVQSEAIILQDLNDLFCTDFVGGLLASGTTIPAVEQFAIIRGVLNTMACKECTIANILQAAAKVISVENGILPSGTPAPPSSCSYCN